MIRLSFWLQIVAWIAYYGNDYPMQQAYNILVQSESSYNEITISSLQTKVRFKDAIRIATSKVTQIIFAVLEDWYHHIVLTHSFKLAMFYIHICFFIAKRRRMSMAHVWRAIAGQVSLRFTFF